MTAYGGLALAHDLAMRLQLDHDLNRSLSLLKLHVPYFESDHVLTHVYNLFVGGNCIEDIGHVQHSEAIKNLLGACRIPDPTTAGDFLRRFGPRDLEALQAVIDRARQKVWRKLPRRQRKVATIDLDSTIKEVYGACKQGADFSYDHRWSYHPLLVTLAETNEPLRTINRPGNTFSGKGAAGVLGEVLPVVRPHFGEVFVRGDSGFYSLEVMAACQAGGARFAVVMDDRAAVRQKAENLPEEAWKPFRMHPAAARKRPGTAQRRRKRTRHLRRIRRQRGGKISRISHQWVAEFTYRHAWRGKGRDHGLGGHPLRVVVRRQRVEASKGEQRLFTEYCYRFVITDIPRSRMTAAEVVRFTYGRCDQENAIEQLKNGIGALRMPTGELLANYAFLMAGQLAWCLRAGLSLLALPTPTLRWQWNWFRHAFVYVPAKITHSARRAVVYVTASHRFLDHILIASRRLQCCEFR